MKRENKLLQLFLTFIKIGALTFGGGYAMIPVMQKEMVEKKKWITKEEIVDMLVISESTPGVLAINAATFIGYKVHRTSGAIIATLGVLLPSLIVITVLSYFIEWFQNLEYVTYAFKGIRAGVAVLIFFSVFKIGKGVKKTVFSLIMLLSSFLIAFFTAINVLFILLGAAALGIIYGLILKRRGKANV